MLYSPNQQFNNSICRRRATEVHPDLRSQWHAKPHHAKPHDDEFGSVCTLAAGGLDDELTAAIESGSLCSTALRQCCQTAFCWPKSFELGVHSGFRDLQGNTVLRYTMTLKAQGCQSLRHPVCRQAA